MKFILRMAGSMCVGIALAGPVAEQADMAGARCVAVDRGRRMKPDVGWRMLYLAHVVLAALVLWQCHGCSRTHTPAVTDAGCQWQAREASVYNEAQAEDVVCLP